MNLDFLKTQKSLSQELFNLLYPLFNYNDDTDMLNIELSKYTDKIRLVNLPNNDKVIVFYTKKETLEKEELEDLINKYKNIALIKGYLFDDLNKILDLSLKFKNEQGFRLFLELLNTYSNNKSENDDTHINFINIHLVLNKIFNANLAFISNKDIKYLLEIYESKNFKKDELYKLNFEFSYGSYNTCLSNLIKYSNIETFSKFFKSTNTLEYLKKKYMNQYKQLKMNQGYYDYYDYNYDRYRDREYEKHQIKLQKENRTYDLFKQAILSDKIDFIQFLIDICYKKEDIKDDTVLKKEDYGYDLNIKVLMNILGDIKIFPNMSEEIFVKLINFFDILIDNEKNNSKNNSKNDSKYDEVYIFND